MLDIHIWLIQAKNFYNYVMMYLF